METKMGQLVYSILAKVDSSFNSTIKKAETDVKDLGKSMEKTEKSSKSTADTLKNFAKAAGLAYLAKLAIDFGKASVQAFANAQQSVIQFNNAEQNLAGTTKEQIENLEQYIQLLEDKTSVDDKSIRQSAQILAQDQISIENQKKLLSGIVDLAVANSKSNGGEVDAAGTARAIGLAFAEGNLGRLVKQNVAGITESQKALFAVGTEAQKTAILMKILDENARGAGEALGNSFQGKLNKAQDILEKIQVTIGEGLVISMNALSIELGDVTANLGGAETAGQGINKVFLFISLSLGLLVKGLMRLGFSFASLATLLGFFVDVAIDAVKDVSNGFLSLGKNVKGVVTAIGKALTGDFAGASEEFKKALDFDFNFKNTKSSMDILKAVNRDLSKSFNEQTASMNETKAKMSDLDGTYSSLKTETEKLTQAKDSLVKKQEKVKEATEAEKKATEDAKKQLQDFNKTLVETLQNSQKTSKELNDNLSKAFTEFGKTLTDTFTDTKDKLAQIVVDAEIKKKELLAKSDRTDEDNKELIALDKTLQARVGFEERAAKQIADIKKKLSDAGLDPNSLQVGDGQTLTSAIDQARLNATLDEFTLFENEQNKKILSITNNFITESLLLKNKIDNQKSLETELTDFLTSENAKRTADIEQFAIKAIQKYGEMASSLRNVISLQNQAGQATGGRSLPQFSVGGYVGNAGGEVHPGEFVIPANLVRANPELVNSLDQARNQTNNVTINQNGVGTTNTRGFLDEMLWRLSRK